MGTDRLVICAAELVRGSGSGEKSTTRTSAVKFELVCFQRAVFLCQLVEMFSITNRLTRWEREVEGECRD